MQTEKNESWDARFTAAYVQAVPLLVELWNLYREWKDARLEKELEFKLNEQFSLKQYAIGEEVSAPEGEGWVSKDSKIGPDFQGAATLTVLWYRVTP